MEVQLFPDNRAFIIGFTAEIPSALESPTVFNSTDRVIAFERIEGNTLIVARDGKNYFGTEISQEGDYFSARVDGVKMLFFRPVRIEKSNKDSILGNDISYYTGFLPGLSWIPQYIAKVDQSGSLVSISLLAKVTNENGKLEVEQITFSMKSLSPLGTSNSRMMLRSVQSSRESSVSYNDSAAESTGIETGQDQNDNFLFKQSLTLGREQSFLLWDQKINYLPVAFLTVDFNNGVQKAIKTYTLAVNKGIYLPPGNISLLSTEGLMLNQASLTEEIGGETRIHVAPMTKLVVSCQNVISDPDTIPNIQPQNPDQRPETFKESLVRNVSLNYQFRNLDTIQQKVILSMPTVIQIYDQKNRQYKNVPYVGENFSVKYEMINKARNEIIWGFVVPVGEQEFSFKCSFTARLLNA